MSEMEALYGTYRKSDHVLFEDEDIYDAEERLEVSLVDVDGQLYEFQSLKSLDPFGFTLTIAPSKHPRLVCLWYNGGAGIHEVVEEAIRKDLKVKSESN